MDREYVIGGGYVIGIDIGGTFLRIGAVDRTLQVRDFRKIPIVEVLQTDDVLCDLESFLKDFISGIEGNVSAVSIGFPATVDRDRKVVLQAPNVRYMENLPIVDYLTEQLQIPVWIERDVCMTMFYDMIDCGVPECEVLAGCYFGTGIGNAIVINGKPLIGKDGTAGEIGHIPVVGSEEPCGCGLRGCMENLAGGKYLAKIRKAFYPDTEIGELFSEHREEKILLDFVDRMAITVATEINILNPDYMLVGGGVPNMRNFPLEYLRQRILAHTRQPFPRQSLQLIFVKDHERKSVVGAAIYAWKKILEEST